MKKYHGYKVSNESNTKTTKKWQKNFFKNDYTFSL